MADTYNMSDVMLSYSRKDKPFVQRLEAALRANGREVWVDWEDIPTGVDFLQEIFAGIEAANTFVFIISPDSVSSAVCLDEVRHAVLHRKRFVPILHREITDEAKHSFHPALSAHNWLFFRDTDNFDDAFKLLIKALDTDIDHVRYHTRLLVRAREWQDKGRTNSLLLRGDDLRDAETWLMRNANKEPAPTDLQREYILASRKGAQARNRIIAGVVSALLVITVLALFAFSQSVIAGREADNAATQAALAEFARGTSDANAIIALDNAATATFAQGQAVAQASTAAAAALIARNAQATSDFNANVAATAAANEALARSTSEANAVYAATQAALAENARATSDYNAQIAEQNAATATIAQGEAVFQASTAAAAAILAQNAQATSDYNANVAATAAANEALARSTSDANARLAATQAVAAEIARSTSDANAIIARQNADAASIAQANAEAQAATAAAAAVIARSAQATSDANAIIAATAASNEALARSTSDANAGIAATQAVAAQNARATSDYNAGAAATQAALALDNAATATFAQGDAEFQAAAARAAQGTAIYQADNAATAAANEIIARATSDANARLAATQAVAAQNARATSDYNAGAAATQAALALDNAATATFAQGDAEFQAATAQAAQGTAIYQANRAATAAAAESVARATSDYNAQVALNNAATAIIAQGMAEFQAATARAAQGTAIYQANNAATAAANEIIARATSEANATVAVAAQQTVIAINSTAAAAADARARGLTLSDSADQIYDSGNPDLALIMALEANKADPTLPESYRALVRMMYSTGTQMILGVRDGHQHTGAVTSIAYSPDGTMLASGGKDGLVKLWQSDTGAFIREFGTSGAEEAAGINVVRFTRDGADILSGDDNGDIVLWDVATGAEVRRFGVSSGYTRIGPIIALALRSDGTVISSNGKNIIAWNPGTGQLAGRNNLSAGAALGGNLALNGNGAYLMLGNSAYGGSNISARQFGFSDGWLSAFGPANDRLLMTPSEDANYFLLRSIATRGDVRRFDGHAGTITSLIFSPDGRYALSGAGGGNRINPDYSIILWDVATGAALHRYYGHTSAVRGLAFSPDESYFVSVSDDGQIRRWKTLPDSPAARYDVSYPVMGMAYAPDGKTLALAYDDQSIALIDVIAGKELRRLVGQPNDFTNFVFSSDGQTLVSADINGSILVWDVSKRTRRGQRLSAGDTAAYIALSPDGSTIYAGTGDGMIRLWDAAANGEVKNRLTSNAGAITALALSPDGSTLVTAHDNPLGDTLVIWDTATGQRKLSVRVGDVKEIIFSPDSQNILVNAANSVQLIDLEAGKSRIFGRGGGAHASAVLDMVFSPDGSAALSASQEDVRLWDVASGRLVYTFAQPATALAYAPDGTLFAEAGQDGTLSLLHIGSRQQLVTWLNANRYVRELSCDERDQYGITPLCSAATRALTPTPPPEIGVINASTHINVRSNPSPNAKPVTGVAPGTEVIVLARIPGWVQVQIPDGRTGWVVDQFVGKK